MVDHTPPVGLHLPLMFKRHSKTKDRFLVWSVTGVLITVQFTYFSIHVDF
jgi:hypothetical protein